MNKFMEYYRTYPTSMRCCWCPYEVSSNVRFRMVQHEKIIHWYKFHVETVVPLRGTSVGQEKHGNSKRGNNSSRKPHDTSEPWKGKGRTDSKMNTCMECYPTYSTSEALKRTSDMHIMLIWFDVLRSIQYCKISYGSKWKDDVLVQIPQWNCRTTKS